MKPFKGYDANVKDTCLILLALADWFRECDEARRVR